jgi:hypothetical protein
MKLVRRKAKSASRKSFVELSEILISNRSSVVRAWKSFLGFGQERVS